MVTGVGNFVKNKPGTYFFGVSAGFIFIQEISLIATNDLPIKL